MEVAEPVLEDLNNAIEPSFETLHQVFVALRDVASEIVRAIAESKALKHFVSKVRGVNLSFTSKVELEHQLTQA